MKNLTNFIQAHIVILKNMEFRRVKMVGGLIIALVFSLLIFNLAKATEPNPGHLWTDIGDGVFQVANTQTAVRTYTFPDANATVLTTNAPVTVAQGGTGTTTLPANTILYGNGTGAILSTASAANNVLTTSTTSIPTLTQILPGAVQTNITSLGAVTAGSIGSGFGNINIGTNIFTGNGSGLTSLNASNFSSGVTTVTYGGTGSSTLTANAVLIGNGTNAVTGVPLSATGTILQSTGTAWVAASSADPVIYASVGLWPNALTAVTALAAKNIYFQYMGAANKNYTSCNVLANVTTAAAGTISYAEVGLFSGVPVLNGSASLSRLGYTSVAATYNSTGIKSTAVTATIPAGTNMWVAFSASSTTMLQLRGMMADNIQTGTFQTITTGQPSTVAIPIATTIAGATVVPVWVTMKCQ